MITANDLIQLLTLINQPQKDANEQKSGPLRIVKMPYANDVVGNVVDCGTYYRIENAAVIRRWGTTEGLGQIAKNGPTDETKLDKCPNIKVQKTAVIYEMDCCAENWQGNL